MNIKRYRYLAGPTAIAAGAGLASSLLFSLMSQGTVFATALACLAPLPIMIAVLGFGRPVGTGAVVAAFLAVAVLVPALGSTIGDAGVLETTLRTALSFAFSMGLPAFWLSYLASSSRSGGHTNRPTNAPPVSSVRREYVSVERLVTASMAIAAAVVVLGAIVVVVRHGSFELAVDRIASDLAPILDDMLGSSVKLPAGYDMQSMARMIVLASAPVAAGTLFLDLILNLWLAGQVTQLSGRLERPWPDIAKELQIPRPYGLLLGVAFATTFLGGPPALIASIVAVVLAMAFALQGLAVVHVISRHWKARGFMLWILYGGVLFLMPSSLFLFALLGLIDSLYSFRNRKAATPPKI